MFIFFIFCFASISCKANTLQIKPGKIEIFKNSKVFAIDKSGRYQIGTLSGQWSAIYDIREKGLSLLDIIVATDSGIYLIGSENRIDADKSTYYTGFITLIDSNNKTLNQWHHDSNFIHASVFKNQLTLTSFDGVFTQDESGVMQMLMGNYKRKRMSSIRDDSGNLILCNSLLPTKNALFTTGSAGCVKADAWDFTGIWFPSDEDFITEPVACGPWLIEPVQPQFKTSITGINVRDMKSGHLVKKFTTSGVKRFFCVNNSEILLDNDMQSYSLPEMETGSKYSCNKNETIISVKNYQDEAICLTSSGYLGKLKKLIIN